jgi:hypothetical protein
MGMKNQKNRQGAEKGEDRAEQESARQSENCWWSQRGDGVYVMVFILFMLSSSKYWLFMSLLLF